MKVGVIGYLPPREKTWIEFLAPKFGAGNHLHYYRHLESEPGDRSALSLSCLSHKQTNLAASLSA